MIQLIAINIFDNKAGCFIKVIDCKCKELSIDRLESLRKQIRNRYKKDIMVCFDYRKL